MGTQAQPRHDGTLDGQWSGDLRQAPQPAAIDPLLRSPGQPLDPAARTFMESRFRHDFTRVRIHDGRDADHAATAYDARAFTLGRHIAFGNGQYAPHTPSGMRLLAHELAHVVQQARDPSPVLRRAPALKGRSTNDLVDERIAPHVDKAIEQSQTIGKFIPAKGLKKETGNIEVDDPVVYAARYKKAGISTANVDDVPGYTDRTAKKPIHLRSQGKNEKNVLVTGATVEVARHEAIHLNSGTQFQNNFGHNYNEGVTQHFTESVLKEQGLSSGKAYPDELKLAGGLISALGPDGEDQVGDAYFKGKLTLYAKVLKALSPTNDFSGWHDAAWKEPPDWQAATSLLTKVLRAPAKPAATTPAATPAAGGGKNE